MSYIFRSDEVQVGDRVVARRIFPTSHPGAAAQHSDIIGHIIATDPLQIRPQQVGGYPSDLPAVSIPAAELKIIKRLSPRTVRNSDIRAIEVATAAAFPGIEHRHSSDGQWLLRAGDGITERSNSAVPTGPSAGFTEVPLAEIHDFYRGHGLPTRLLIPQRIGKAAENLIAAQPQDWQLGPEIVVMARDIAADAPSPASAASTAPWSFSFDPQPDEHWLALYHFRGQRLPAHALELLRTDIAGRMVFARARDHDGRTVAITRGTITADGAGRRWLGFSAVEVDENYRRRGLGTALGHELLRWAVGQADRAYLHVIATNIAGRALYERLGFTEHHRQRSATWRGAKVR